MSTPTAFSLPAAAPHYAPPPYRYRKCELTVVPFLAPPGVTRRLVPEPLEPNPDDLMLVAVGDMHNDTLGTTKEAFVVVPVSDGATTGNFTVFLYLESDACITSGREIWGWPKKQAQIETRDAGGRHEAVVKRAGRELIHLTVEASEDVRPEDLGLSPVWFNLKVIPSVIEGAPPEVMQITATTFRDLTVTRARGGEAQLRLAGGGEDPLADLIPVSEVLPGARIELDFDLLFGEVVHDYLTEAGTTRARRVPVAAR